MIGMAIRSSSQPEWMIQSAIKAQRSTTQAIEQRKSIVSAQFHMLYRYPLGFSSYRAVLPALLILVLCSVDSALLPYMLY